MSLGEPSPIIVVAHHWDRDRLVTVPVPAAGADFTYTLTDDAVVRAVFVGFTASASVGNRNLALDVTSPDNRDIARFGIPTNIAAGQSIHGGWWEAAGYGTLVQGLSGSLPQVKWPKGTVFASKTVGLLAGDQYTQITFVLSRMTDRQ